VRNFGQTAAMQAGFDYSRGEVVVSMDGDLQNDPRDIPRLVSRLLEGYDLVAGYRVRRQDRLVTRKIPSWLANRLIRLITGVPIRDNGCSLKAYRRELLDRMYLYSDMHRFIPAMAAAMAAARITEMPVRHHPRVHGESKYGLTRIWKVIPDLVAIKMLSSFRDRPLQMFGAGAVAAGFMAVGFGLLTLVSIPGGVRSTMVSALVFPSVVLVWLSLAFFLLMVGLIAEVVVKGEQEPGFHSLPVLREW
jgi:glycosyltransferase involved in cell wall biosynthesis